jgi:triosephosphate isomerase (TIM)
MRRILVAGNWKMNTTRAVAEALAGAVAAGAKPHLGKVDVLVCPPFPYLVPVASKLAGSGVRLGGQNAWHEPKGAFTGEVSVDMLLDAGCTDVLVGHSERRHVLGESDELLNKKVKAGIARGIRVIYCVGELPAERSGGKTNAVLERQMDSGLAGVDAGGLERVIIAYEPVWAIGTGVTATPEQAQQAHAHLRKWIEGRYNSEAAAKMIILYGGSVTAKDAPTLFSQPDVDGGLVGGASLEAAKFVPIIEAAAATPVS